MDHESVDEHPTAGAQQLSVEVVERPGVLVVAVDGEIDIATAPRLRAAVADALARLDGRRLVVDLRKVGFLGACGLQLLVDVAAEAGRHDGAAPLRVVVTDAAQVIRPITLGGLTTMLALHPSVDSAAAG